MILLVIINVPKQRVYNPGRKFRPCIKLNILSNQIKGTSEFSYRDLRIRLINYTNSHD